jgi:hypothetical protein
MRKTNIGLEWKGRKRFSKQMNPKTSRSSYTYIWQSRLETKTKKDNEGLFILIKGTIHQEEITVLNIYAPNVSIPDYTKKTLLDIKA